MSSDNHGDALVPLLAMGAAGLLTRPAQAAEPEPLDEEFLEYLSQLEGEQDDWTLFEAEDDKPAPAKPAAPPAAPSKQAATKPTKVAAPKVQSEVER